MSGDQGGRKQPQKPPMQSISPTEESALKLQQQQKQLLQSSSLFIPTSPPTPLFEAAVNTKRPRFASGSTSSPQWKPLPSPSSQPPKASQLVPLEEASSSPTTNPNVGQRNTESSDTESSHPSQSPAPSHETAPKTEGDTNPALGAQQFRKGKYVSPVWKPYEMLWLARAWRAQYQAGQDNEGIGGQSSRGKTRADKDREVAEFLNRHGVNRDAKTAGTKWDNMLGEFRKVYEWERSAEREQFGKSYFRLSPYERKLRRLPASFDEEVFDELSQFMASRVRTSQNRSGDEGRTSTLRVLPLPPPPPFKDDEDPQSSSGRTRQQATAAGEGYVGFEGTGGLKNLRRIGKVRMTWEESVSLWGEGGEDQRGRVRVQGVSSFLNTNELSFFDENMIACSLESYECGPLQGFSVDKFVPGQQVKVFGRTNPSSFPTPPATTAAPQASIERIQLPFTEPAVRSILPTEYQDPTEYYVGCLRVPPASLPVLAELSWYLQEPPPEELRFPLRKDVYRDLPSGKELFFVSSTELLDCRGITYDVVSTIIRGIPIISMASIRDDCVNRIVSKFCAVELVLLRKPSLGSSDSYQDEWPNMTGFVRNFCLWRGEEADSLHEGQPEPASLLEEKLLWTYNDLPYILGYYAVGSIVTFCALSRSRERIVRTDLYTLDLSSPAERMSGLVPCYRVASLLPLLADRCLNNNVNLSKPSLFSFSDFERVETGDGSVTEMTPITVTKVFRTRRRWAAVKEMHELFDHRIPHAEFVCKASDRELALVFKPRGVKFKPVNYVQLVEALKCVAKALVALHDLGVMHRSLSWEKVMMKRPSEDAKVEWFVCGFEDAAGSPQLYPHAPPSALARHAPEMGRGLHGVKVDVWGIGHLIKTCGLGSSGLPTLLRELQNRCLDGNPEQRPTAADCYHHLLQVQSAAVPFD